MSTNKKQNRDRERGKNKGRGRQRSYGNYIENVDQLKIAQDEEDDEDDDEEQEQAGETVFAFEPKEKKGDEADLADDMGELAIKPKVKKAAPKVQEVVEDEEEGEGEPTQLSRKQKEALAAQKAKEDYQRRHAAGETEQAKKELAQLALVKARREAARLKREAEGRPPGWSANGIDSDGEKEPEEAPKPEPILSEVAAKKKAAAAEVVPDEPSADGPEKLKAMDIKKMNGDALKDACKERGLNYQGQKKDLMKRLLDFEAARA